MPRQTRQLARAKIQEAHSDLQSLLGPPPLLEGEDAAAYDNLRNRFRLAIGPQDAIEEIWVRETADLVWEAMRLRRFKTKFMNTSIEGWIRGSIWEWTTTRNRSELIIEWKEEKNELVDGWDRGDPASVAKVNALLKERHFDQDKIAMEVFLSKLDTLERFDRMIMQCEARRNLILREVDRHRDILAQRLREVASRIEEAEFSVIEDRTETETK